MRLCVKRYKERRRQEESEQDREERRQKEGSIKCKIKWNTTRNRDISYMTKHILKDKGEGYKERTTEGSREEERRIW